MRAVRLAAAALLLLPASHAAGGQPENLLEDAGPYTVRAGDRFSAIAQRMGVTVDALAAANRMVPPYILRVGQVLKRPDPERAPKRIAPPPAPAKAPAKAPATREASAPRLVWPTSGAVTARFGAPVKGLANNGIDLAAFAGMTVHAAAAGKVVFAGTEPERFGQLIVIDHGGSWVTAYAYLGQVRVKEGERVKARQIIARIGKSGEARRPGLHFELRKGTSPRNPALYLPIRL
ncbi:MAG: LysM peptidoglycan-binding domain-containing M23 family metallopeptidase [Novosphingobium sp.]|nr:LysM peptidoglycan-binding domain-containing M23 family metallopeptidase [Novosphingobium sp.]